MSLELRPISESEYERWNQVPYAGFSEIPPPSQIAMWRAKLEFDRTLGALEDGDFVGTTAVNSFQMHVPGGAMVPTAGVTAVSVLPTHRRRGVLSAMMRRQLDDIRAAGEPLAALWASESVIYPRFGYGLAVSGEEWHIDRVRAEFVRPPNEESGGRVRMASREDVASRFEGIYERVVGAHHGMLQPPDSWWYSTWADGPWSEAAEKHEPFLAIYDRNGVDEGFISYQVTDWTSPRGGRQLDVQRLIASTSEAHEALWRFAFGVDLVDRIHARNRSVGDALPWMLRDQRQLERSVFDMIWLRLVDVPRALEARTYSTPARLVIEVADTFCPWNEGTYILESDASGAASCTPTDEAPHLSLSASDLGAIYLGGTSPTTLARAGRVTEQLPGALAKAEAMFRTDAAPWCDLDF